ncbi:MAG: glycosyltransferase family 39 protein [Endomicrobiales bacterium]|nr:glycosyltransferase family 39 protein [Endomicrobiales bacterium]
MKGPFKNPATRDILLVSLFCVLLQAPFLAKPFNVDDPFYLKAAHQILKDPLRPYSFSINWSGETRDAWERMEATFPPLVPAFIAAIIGVFGENELALHLLFLFFPVVSGIGIYFLLKKYTKTPLFYSLIFVSVPCFAVSATSVMLDVPLAAFFLSSLVLFMYGVDSDNVPKIVAGAFLAGMAGLVKYSALVLPFLFAAYVIQNKKYKYAVWITLPVALTLLWWAHNLAVYGGIHFFLASAHIGKGLTLHKALAVPAFMAGVMVFPLVSLLMLKKKGIVVFLVELALLFAVVGNILNDRLSALLFSFLWVSGFTFVFQAGRGALAKDWFVLIWFSVSILMLFGLEPWVSARYVLFALAPSLIAFSFITEKTNVVIAKYGRVFVAIAAVVGAMFNLSDYLWARAYRDFPDYVRSKGYMPAHSVGHFGFQYYLEKEGIEALDFNKAGQIEGYVIMAKNADPQRPPSDLLKRLELVEQVPAESAYPVRVMSGESYSGFYSSFWGILPANVSKAPLDTFVVYRIKRKRDI